MALIAALFLGLVLLAWQRDGLAPWREAPSGLGLREIAAAPVMAQVALVGAIHAPPSLGAILLGLTFAEAGRGVGDVGLFFVAFVAVEVAATLLIVPLARRWPRLHVIAAGIALYAVALGALPLLAGSPWVWALIVPAGVGGALIYALTMGTLQDLLAARPGAGASMFALQKVAGDGPAATAYGLGAWAGGHAAAALLGVAAGVGAMAALLRFDASGVEEAGACARQ